jgi:hypothetical protein
VAAGLLILWGVVAQLALLRLGAAVDEPSNSFVDWTILVAGEQGGEDVLGLLI